MNAKDLDPAINAAQVAAWLKAHPDFFVGNDELLEGLRVPHVEASHGSVSLLERQLVIARQRLESVEQRLHGLLNTARDTEVQYRQLRGLVLTLLESESEDDLFQSLGDQLAEQLDIPVLALWRTGTTDNALETPQFALDEPRSNLLSRLLEGRHCKCVALNQVRWASLLPHYTLTNTEGSAAITRLAIGAQTGYLLLGSPSPDRFTATLDTLFVDYLGEVIGRLLNRVPPGP